VLDAAQVNLDYTDIISPVDGTVVSRNVTMGQTVAASFQTPTLFLIATDLTKMQVDANVSESDIGGIKNGNKATFTIDAYAKRAFEGTVTQVRQSHESSCPRHANSFYGVRQLAQRTSGQRAAAPAEGA
jgi:HlyD family secretion protein